MQRKITFIQKFRPFVEKIFWVHGHKKRSCYHVTFHMKFAENKIVYLRQHFEETVKPGKKIIIDDKIKAFFLKNQLYGNISF